MAPGVKGRGTYIPVPSSSLCSSPIPLPLRPRHSARHTEDAAATPPDVGRRHRLARVHGPHATQRTDDLAAPAAARPPRPDGRPHRRYSLAPARRAGHTVPSSVLTRRDDEAANARGFLSSIPEVRCLLHSISRLHRDRNRSMMRSTMCLLRSYSISMHETHVLGKFTIMVTVRTVVHVFFSNVHAPLLIQ